MFLWNIGRCGAPGPKSGGRPHEEDKALRLATMAGCWQEAWGLSAEDTLHSLPADAGTISEIDIEVDFYYVKSWLRPIFLYGNFRDKVQAAS